jgi:hypothetical protein
LCATISSVSPVSRRTRPRARRRASTVAMRAYFEAIEAAGSRRERARATSDRRRDRRRRAGHDEHAGAARRRSRGTRRRAGRDRPMPNARCRSPTRRSHAVTPRCAGTSSVRVVDLGSTNGTQVNGVVVKEHSLNDGDVIVVGATSLRYQES